MLYLEVGRESGSLTQSVRHWSAVREEKREEKEIESCGFSVWCRVIIVSTISVPSIYQAIIWGKNQDAKVLLRAP